MGFVSFLGSNPETSENRYWQLCFLYNLMYECNGAKHVCAVPLFLWTGVSLYKLLYSLLLATPWWAIAGNKTRMRGRAFNSYLKQWKILSLRKWITLIFLNWTNPRITMRFKNRGQKVLAAPKTPSCEIYGHVFWGNDPRSYQKSCSTVNHHFYKKGYRNDYQYSLAALIRRSRLEFTCLSDIAFRHSIFQCFISITAW